MNKNNINDLLHILLAREYNKIPIKDKLRLFLSDGKNSEALLDGSIAEFIGAKNIPNFSADLDDVLKENKLISLIKDKYSIKKKKDYLNLTNNINNFDDDIPF